MKKVIFMVLLLAVASLGSALPPQKQSPYPQKQTPHPETPAPHPETPAPHPQTPSPPPQTSVSPLAVLAHADSPQAIADGVNVSPGCAAAIFTIVTDPEILKCLPMNAILPLLPIVTDPNLGKDFKSDPAGTFKKLEKPLVQFSDGFCPVQACSSDVIVKSVDNLGKSCADDLKTNQVIQMMFAFFVFYSPIHDSICFKSSSSKEYCWDESLTTVVALPKSPIKVTGDAFFDAIAVADCKSVCTNCNKDFVSTFFNYIGDTKNPLHDTALKILAGAGLTQDKLDQLKVAVAVKCGISFEDGKVPDKPGK